MNETPESDKFLARFPDTGLHAVSYMKSFERQLRAGLAVLVEIAALKRHDPNAARSSRHAIATVNIPRPLVERMDAVVRGEIPTESGGDCWNQPRNEP